MTYEVKSRLGHSGRQAVQDNPDSFMCRSTMVEGPTERYQNRGVPVYLQETLEDPALQGASPTPALPLYFPTPSTALSVLPSMTVLYFYSVTSDGA